MLNGWMRSFLFHPTTTTAGEFDAFAQDGFSKAAVEVEPGVTVVGLIRPPASATANWLLFFAGNAFNLAGSREVLRHVAADLDIGLAVFAYRGYDGSGGEPSERALVADAKTIAQWLETSHDVTPDRLVLMGQSLGTGVAAQLAASLQPRQGPAGLVLVAAYASMAEVFDDHVPAIPVGWLVPDPFRTESHLASISAPALVIHGEDDTLIHIGHGRRVAAGLTDAKFVALAKCGHNEIWAEERAATEVRRFVRELGERSR